MNDCTHCKYADWKRTGSGRLHPSGDGKCTFPWKLPQIPACMYWLTPPSPMGGTINRRQMLKDHCPYFAMKDA